MHIIGTTGEGKSKFLEWLIRGDIANGNGLCFLDPSDRGDTMYKILSYCAKIGHRKVLVIDPFHTRLYGKTAPINPLKGYKEACVANVLDIFRILFNVRDAAETARIQRYLTAILSVLWNAKATLHESLYFTEPIYIEQRIQILEQSDRQDRHRLALEEVFKSRAMYLNELQSTVRRLEPLYHPTFDLMFGSTSGIDFARLIADKWVVLVNLYSGFGFEPIHTRLLGTAIINEIISAIDRLKAPRKNKDGTIKRPWKGVYYLYIDEAGRYANRNLADLLAYKRKSGLRVTLAHQYNDQFDDPFILKAIKQLCKIKVAFYQPDSGDRLETVKQMFGGELKDRDVSYALSALKKQHAVIKKPKEAPMTVRVPDVPDINIDYKPYLEKVFENSVYRTPDEIKEEQRQRLASDTIHYDTRPAHNYPKSTRSRKKVDSRPASEDSLPIGNQAVDDLFAQFSAGAPPVSPRLPADATDTQRPSGDKKPTRKKTSRSKKA